MSTRYQGHALASGLLLAIALLAAAAIVAGDRVPPAPEVLGLAGLVLGCLALAWWSWRTRVASAPEDPHAFERRFRRLRGLFFAALVAAGLYLLSLERPIAGALVVLWGLHRLRAWRVRAHALRETMERAPPADDDSTVSGAGR